MAKFDQKNDLLVVINKGPTAISTNTTTNGISVDTRGYEALTFAFESGTLTDGTYTPLIEESDDNTNWTAVADEDLIGLEADNAFAATADNTVKTIGYRGHKRYVRPSIVSAGTTTGGTMSIRHILGKPVIAPVA